MYAGKVVESGSVDDLFRRPLMPYTLGLIGALPRLTGRQPLVPIPGRRRRRPRMPSGCPFATRCPLVERLPRDRAGLACCR